MTEKTRKPYLTDLTDEQWAILEPLIPPAKPGGRPRAVDIREVINTILCLNRTSCQWDLFPTTCCPKVPSMSTFPSGAMAPGSA
jgi:putative transposase